MRGSRVVAWALAASLGAIPLGAQGDGAVAGSVTVPGPGLSGVVVYLVPARGTRSTPPRPFATQIDQRDLRFVPRVIAATPGTTVSFPNSDPVMHNVFHPSERAGGGFDLGTYPPGEARSFTFRSEGAYVIFCHVHPEMVAYVVVIASPHRAVTDEHGAFRIDSITPGTYYLRTWHRRLRTNEQIVRVSANGVTRVVLPLKFGFPVEPRTSGR